MKKAKPVFNPKILKERMAQLDLERKNLIERHINEWPLHRIAFPGLLEELLNYNPVPPPIRNKNDWDGRLDDLRRDLHHSIEKRWEAERWKLHIEETIMIYRETGNLLVDPPKFILSVDPYDYA